MKNLTTVMGEEINKGITEMYMDALQEDNTEKITFKLKQLEKTANMVFNELLQNAMTLDEANYLNNRVTKAYIVVKKHLDFINDYKEM